MGSVQVVPCPLYSLSSTRSGCWPALRRCTLGRSRASTLGQWTVWTEHGDGKYLVTHRKYLVLHCYFDGAPAFPDKSQFLTAPVHLAAGSTYSPHSSVTDNCRHGDFRHNIFFRLYETTCKRCKMMFDNVQLNILLAESCPHIKIITVVHKTFTNSWFGLTKTSVHLRYICKLWTRIEDSIFYFNRWDHLLKCPLPQ